VIFKKVGMVVVEGESPKPRLQKINNRANVYESKNPLNFEISPNS